MTDNMSAQMGQHEYSKDQYMSTSSGGVPPLLHCVCVCVCVCVLVLVSEVLLCVLQVSW